MLHRDLRWSGFNSAASQSERDNNCLMERVSRKPQAHQSCCTPPTVLYSLAPMERVEDIPANRSSLYQT